MFYAVLVTDKPIAENIMAFTDENDRYIGQTIARSFGYNLRNVNATYVSNMPVQYPTYFECLDDFRVMLSDLKQGNERYGRVRSS